MLFIRKQKPVQAYPVPWILKKSSPPFCYPADLMKKILQKDIIIYDGFISIFLYDKAFPINASEGWIVLYADRVEYYPDEMFKLTFETYVEREFF